MNIIKILCKNNEVIYNDENPKEIIYNDENPKEIIYNRRTDYIITIINEIPYIVKNKRKSINNLYKYTYKHTHK
jgi:predicted site-specific integrase-resolvase